MRSGRAGTHVAVQFYGQPWFAFFSSCFLRDLLHFLFRPRLWSGVGQESKLPGAFETEQCRSRRGSSVSAGPIGVELEPAGEGCARGRIGGGAAVSRLSAEDGDAGPARGGNCVVLHTPAPAELECGTRTNNKVGPFGTGAAGFRCYGRRRAGLQLGFGASHFGTDRSGRQHWKHGAAWRRVWRPLEIHERGQPEFQSCVGHLAGFD